MKKKKKQLIFAAFFGVILVTSTLAFAVNSFRPPQKNEPITTTTTGTPADNYSDDKRATFCGTNSTKSNRYITEFSIPTYCSQPIGVTTDSQGLVWFTEYNTGNLAKFDPISKQFTEIQNTKWPDGGQSMMWGITSSQDGNIWYTDEAHDVLWKFDQKNFTSFRYPPSESGQTFPQKISIDGNDIIVNDFTGNKITFFDSTQTGSEIQYSKVTSPTNDTLTSAFTIDTDKSIWYMIWKFQQGGELVRYDPQTSQGTSINLPLGILAPNGISSDKENKIWMTDAATSFFFNYDKQTNTFTKFITPEPPRVTFGNSSGLIKSPISRPYWNHFDGSGRLWFNEQTGNSLAVFDPKTEKLIEYLVPSRNPNWSDCSGLKDCGVAQVLDFTIDKDKVWFTEWVENNIGVLDSSLPLPIDTNIDKKNIHLSRSENSTVLITITPNEKLSDPVKLISSSTANLSDIKFSSQDNIEVRDQPVTIPFEISVDKFALSGTYKIGLGARYQDITISDYVTLTVS